MLTCAQKLVRLPRTLTSTQAKILFKRMCPFSPRWDRAVAQRRLPSGKGKNGALFALLEVEHRVGELQGEIGEERDPQLVKAALDVRVEHQGGVERWTETGGGGQK